MAQSKAIHSPEALSRTGAVKVLPRPDAVSMTCGTICLEYEDRDRRDAAYDWLENHAYAPLSALEPAAPEGRQKAARPYAYEFGRSNGDGTYSVFIERSLPAKPHPDWPVKPLYTRPSEQAVTEAMVEAAANSIANIWCTGDLKAIARAALKAAMEAGNHD